MFSLIHGTYDIHMQITNYVSHTSLISQSVSYAVSVEFR